MDSVLIRRIRAATARFNRYRSPEIRSRLVSLKGRELIMEFNGSSCRSCGAQDHMEDLALEASDSLGARVSLQSFTPWDDSGFRARYRVGEEVDEG